ncbi:DUF397 domain-containing protein [Kitasatospora sp. NPDC015120]|uniref:DUF397 domain-containing protein n=1 Tax=Kitasatospora sp. NPDC015120 TaxID=3364023 RepID=UPI0036F45DB8
MSKYLPNAAASGLTFKKSSFSGNNVNCVECAVASGEVVVRDSKNPTGPALRYDAAAFTAFVNAVATDALVPATA